MPATRDLSTDDSPAESYPAESWMAELELVALSNAFAEVTAPVAFVMLSCVPERCVLFGERSPATPKVQLSPGWYSTPPEKVPTRPPRRQLDLRRRGGP